MSLINNLANTLTTQQTSYFRQLQKELLNNIKNKGVESIETWKNTKDIIEVLNKQGQMLLKKGDYNLAENYFLTAKQFSEPKDSDFAWARKFYDWHQKRMVLAINLGMIYRHRQQIQKSEEVLKDVLEDLETFSFLVYSKKKKDKYLTSLLFNLAETYYSTQAYDQCYEYAEQVLDLLESLQDKNQKSFTDKNKFSLIKAQCLCYKGEYFSESLQEYQKAVYFLKHSFEISKEILGPTHVQTQMYLSKYEELQGSIQFQDHLQTDRSTIPFDDFKKDISQSQKIVHQSSLKDQNLLLNDIQSPINQAKQNLIKKSQSMGFQNYNDNNNQQQYLQDNIREEDNEEEEILINSQLVQEQNKSQEKSQNSQQKSNQQDNIQIQQNQQQNNQNQTHKKSLFTQNIKLRQQFNQYLRPKTTSQHSQQSKQSQVIPNNQSSIFQNQQQNSMQIQNNTQIFNETIQNKSQQNQNLNNTNSKQSFLNNFNNNNTPQGSFINIDYINNKNNNPKNYVSKQQMKQNIKKNINQQQQKFNNQNSNYFDQDVLNNIKSNYVKNLQNNNTSQSRTKAFSGSIKTEANTLNTFLSPKSNILTTNYKTQMTQQTLFNEDNTSIPQDNIIQQQQSSQIKIQDDFIQNQNNSKKSQFHLKLQQQQEQITKSIQQIKDKQKMQKQQQKIDHCPQNSPLQGAQKQQVQPLVLNRPITAYQRVKSVKSTHVNPTSNTQSIDQKIANRRQNSDNNLIQNKNKKSTSEYFPQQSQTARDRNGQYQIERKKNSFYDQKNMFVVPSLSASNFENFEKNFFHHKNMTQESLYNDNQSTKRKTIVNNTNTDSQMYNSIQTNDFLGLYVQYPNNSNNMNFSNKQQNSQRRQKALSQAQNYFNVQMGLSNSKKQQQPQSTRSQTQTFNNYFANGTQQSQILLQDSIIEANQNQSQSPQKIQNQIKPRCNIRKFPLKKQQQASSVEQVRNLSQNSQQKFNQTHRILHTVSNHTPQKPNFTSKTVQTQKTQPDLYSQVVNIQNQNSQTDIQNKFSRPLSQYQLRSNKSINNCNPQLQLLTGKQQLFNKSQEFNNSVNSNKSPNQKNRILNFEKSKSPSTNQSKLKDIINCSPSQNEPLVDNIQSKKLKQDIEGIKKSIQTMKNTNILGKLSKNQKNQLKETQMNIFSKARKYKQLLNDPTNKQITSNDQPIQKLNILLNRPNFDIKKQKKKIIINKQPNLNNLQEDNNQEIKNNFQNERLNTYQSSLSPSNNYKSQQKSKINLTKQSSNILTENSQNNNDFKRKQQKQQSKFFRKKEDQNQASMSNLSSMQLLPTNPNKLQRSNSRSSYRSNKSGNQFMKKSGNQVTSQITITDEDDLNESSFNSQNLPKSNGQDGNRRNTLIIEVSTPQNKVRRMSMQYGNNFKALQTNKSNSNNEITINRRKSVADHNLNVSPQKFLNNQKKQISAFSPKPDENNFQDKQFQFNKMQNRQLNLSKQPSKNSGKPSSSNNSASNNNYLSSEPGKIFGKNLLNSENENQLMMSQSKSKKQTSINSPQIASRSILSLKNFTASEDNQYPNENSQFVQYKAAVKIQQFFKLVVKQQNPDYSLLTYKIQQIQQIQSMTSFDNQQNYTIYNYTRNCYPIHPKQKEEIDLQNSTLENQNNKVTTVTYDQLETHNFNKQQKKKKNNTTNFMRSQRISIEQPQFTSGPILNTEESSCQKLQDNEKQFEKNLQQSKKPLQYEFLPLGFYKSYCNFQLKMQIISKINIDYNLINPTLNLFQIHLQLFMEMKGIYNPIDLTIEKSLPQKYNTLNSYEICNDLLKDWIINNNMNRHYKKFKEFQINNLKINYYPQNDTQNIFKSLKEFSQKNSDKQILNVDIKQPMPLIVYDKVQKQVFLNSNIQHFQGFVNKLQFIENQKFLEIKQVNGKSFKIFNSSYPGEINSVKQNLKDLRKYKNHKSYKIKWISSQVPKHNVDYFIKQILLERNPQNKYRPSYKKSGLNSIQFQVPSIQNLNNRLSSKYNLSSQSSFSTPGNNYQSISQIQLKMSQKVINQENSSQNKIASQQSLQQQQMQNNLGLIKLNNKIQEEDEENENTPFHRSLQSASQQSFGRMMQRFDQEQEQNSSRLDLPPPPEYLEDQENNEDENDDIFISDYDIQNQKDMKLINSQQNLSNKRTKTLMLPQNLQNQQQYQQRFSEQIINPLNFQKQNKIIDNSVSSPNVSSQHSNRSLRSKQQNKITSLEQLDQTPQSHKATTKLSQFSPAVDTPKSKQQAQTARHINKQNSIIKQYGGNSKAKTPSNFSKKVKQQQQLQQQQKQFSQQSITFSPFMKCSGATNSKQEQMMESLQLSSGNNTPNYQKNQTQFSDSIEKYKYQESQKDSIQEDNFTENEQEQLNEENQSKISSKTQSEISSMITDKNDAKSSSSSIQLVASQQNKRNTMLQFESVFNKKVQEKYELHGQISKLIIIPHTHINPFTQEQLLFNDIIKKGKLYFHVTTRFCFPSNLSKSIFRKSAFEKCFFRLKFDLILQKSKWSDFKDIPFKLFVRWFLNRNFDFQKFLLIQGFNKQQKQLIYENCQQYFSINHCDLELNYYLYEKQQKKRKLNLKKIYTITHYLQQEYKNIQVLQEIIQTENRLKDNLLEQIIQKIQDKVNNQQQKKNEHIIQHQQKINTIGISGIDIDNNNENEDNQQYINKNFKQLLEKNITQDDLDQFKQDKERILPRKIELTLEEQREYLLRVETNKNININDFRILKSELLRNYNTLQFPEELQNGVFYINLKKIGYRFKIIYDIQNGFLIQIYNPFKKQSFTITVDEPDTIDKIINILSITNDMDPEKHQYNLYMQQKILINNLLKKQTTFGKQFYILPMLSQNVQSLDLGIGESALKTLVKDDKDIGIEEINNCMHIMKIILLRGDIEQFQQRKHPFLIFYFDQEQYIYNYRIQNLKSRAMIYFTIFKSKVYSNIKPCVFARMDIIPINNCKSKVIKIVLEESDITNIFDLNFNYQNAFEKFRFLAGRITNNLTYSKTYLYKELKLCTQKLYPQQTKKQKFDLVNSRNSVNLETYSVKSITRRSMFQPVLKGKKVVYQGVKILSDQYTILTITYYRELDYYNFNIYVPKTTRTFSTQLYKSDIINFSNQFLQEKLNWMFIKDNINQFLKQDNYLQLCNDLQDIVINMNENMNRQQQKKLKQNITNLNIFKQTFEVFQNITDNSNCEIKIWEVLMEDLVLERNSQRKFVLSLDTYKSILRENLTNNLSNIYGQENAYIEVFFESQRFYPTNIDQPFKYIRSCDALSFTCLIRINFFERVNTNSEKVFVRKMLKYFYDNKMDQLQNKNKQNLESYSQFEFTHSDLIKISKYLIYLIKKNFSEKFLENNKITATQQLSLIKQENNLIKQLTQYEDQESYFPKLNCNMNFTELLKLTSKTDDQIVQQQQNKYQLIYRGVFTKKPQQIIAIMLLQKKKRFRITIYNSQGGEITQRKISFTKVEVHIPFVKNMIKLKQYNEIGQRILYAFKNQIIISMCMHPDKSYQNNKIISL